MMSSRSSSSSSGDRKRKRGASEDRETEKDSLLTEPAPLPGTSRGVGGSGYASNNAKMLTRRHDYSSDSSEDEKERDQKDPEAFRKKKLRKVDTSNPFSTFERQTQNRKKYAIPSSFARDKWLKMRGMDESGKYVVESVVDPHIVKLLEV